MVIAVDFDGTCVTHEFPKIGKDIGAIPVLRKLVEKEHQIILYTMRSHCVAINVLPMRVLDLWILFRKLLIGFVKTRFLYMVSMKILPNIIELPLKRYLHIFI